MLTLLAGLPILIVLTLMIGRGWNGQKAGAVGWLAGVLISALFFGLTWQVFWVSQARGLYLSLFVLAILWPALLLYRVVEKAGGIQAITDELAHLVVDPGMLVIGIAWAFSGVLEGLAGFGLPVAVVSPMLVSLGVAPVQAVAATAVGHAWAVTFGNMGVIFQTLTVITGVSAEELIAPAGALLGTACMLCGWGSLRILGHGRLWLKITVLGTMMAWVQYGLARFGLIPMSSFGAALVGLLGVVLWSRKPGAQLRLTPALRAGIGSYAGLAALMAVTIAIPLVRIGLETWQFRFSFEETVTLLGYTQAASTQILKPLTHPGAALLITALVSFGLLRRSEVLHPGSGKSILQATWKTASPTSLGVVFMVGLSAVLEASGMMLNIAQALSSLMGAAFPLVSPFIGMLGAFATGSNNNSNVMFAPLQQSAALLLAMDARLLLAAQTSGGALGSMIAPAKILVGCSTVGLKDGQGEVLKRTLGYGLVIGLLLGGLTFWLAR